MKVIVAGPGDFEPDLDTITEAVDASDFDVLEVVSGPRCAVEGCANPHYARGLCKAHHRRLRKHGDPESLRCRSCGRVAHESGMERRGNFSRCAACAEGRPAKPQERPEGRRDRKGRLACATEGCPYPVGLHSERDGFAVCQECYWKEVRAG